MSSALPKINRKSAQRAIIWLFSLAVLILAFQIIRGFKSDFTAPSKTVGLVAAIKQTENGAKIVVVHPDGKVVDSPGFKEGSNDRDLVWSGDGGFLFFVSDRDNGESHVFRWAIDSNKVERRSIDKRTKTAPWFPPSTSPEANLALVVSGGNVLEFDPKDGASIQLLPPVTGTASASTEEEGSTGQFDGTYAKIGISFRTAQWTPDKKWIAAVMRREEGGEVLIIQDMTTSAAPMIIAAGDRIDFDVNPVSGDVLFLSTGFEFPSNQVPKEFIKDGKVVRPFKHFLGIFQPSNKAVLVVGASDENKNAFAEPKVSPDGLTIVLTAGPYLGDGSVKPETLIALPFAEKGITSATKLADGTITGPSWGVDSQTIYFSRIGKDGRRALCQIEKDGSREKSLATDGDFSSPKASPQKG